jgi:ribosome recycling factor
MKKQGKGSNRFSVVIGALESSAPRMREGCLKDIEKAVRSSDLGMSPTNDGKMIRLQVPPMSGDQRQKMVARIKKSAEDAKVACRNVRRDGNKHFDQAEKAKEMTEDDREKGKEQVQ